MNFTKFLYWFWKEYWIAVVESIWTAKAFYSAGLQRRLAAVVGPMAKVGVANEGVADSPAIQVGT